MLVRIISVCTTISLVVAGAALADECRFKDERRAAVDVAGASLVVVDAGSGSLRITGLEGASEVDA